MMYFDYIEQPFLPPPELDGVAGKHSVIVAGAGPVGLCVALAMARQGIRSVVLEKRSTISYGSRAICISQRSLDILQKLSASDAFLAQGYAWASGKTYFRNDLVLEFDMPRGADAMHPSMINLQQCYIEQILYEEALKTGLVEVRWHSTIVDVRQTDDRVQLEVETPAGRYHTTADFLVACDGARSFVRNHLGLCLEGNSYEGRYIIADIQMRSALQGRRVWFDPPSNRGSTLVMHCQPKDIIRIDYQLLDDEDAEAEAATEKVVKRVQAHLDWIGESGPWKLEWVSVYKAHSRTLDNYLHGRVLFAGDAAHLVPIFGVRGLNGGFEDAINLTCRLGPVIKRDASIESLQGYSRERVAAARENMKQAEKSAAFMTPPTRGHRLLRDAVLSLAVNQSFVRELINPRQSKPIPYSLDDAIEGCQEAETTSSPVGLACPNWTMRIHGQHDAPSSLYDLLGEEVTLLIFGAGAKNQRRLQKEFPNVAIRRILRSEESALPGDGIDKHGNLWKMFGIDARGAVLVRADGYVAGLWRHFDAFEDLSARLEIQLANRLK